MITNIIYHTLSGNCIGACILCRISNSAVFDSGIANCRMIIENVIAGLTRNLLIVFGNWGIAGQARNDEARQFEMHPYSTAALQIALNGMVSGL
jgi:hypothetical protein